MADQRHPIVERYLRGSSPSFRPDGPEADPIRQAISLLQDAYEGRCSLDKALRQMARTPALREDPDLHVLVQMRWAQLASAARRIDEAAVLIGRLRESIASRTPPEVVAAVRDTEATIVSMRGKVGLREALLREALQIVPAASPHRRSHLMALAFFLARCGRLEELRKEVREDRLVAAETHGVRYDLIEFVNAVETGQREKADSLRETIEAGLGPQDRYHRARFQTYVRILGLYDHRWQADTPRLLALTDDDRLESMLRAMPPPEADINSLETTYWEHIVCSLLLHRPDQALRLARLDEATARYANITYGFIPYDLLRSELAAGHAEAAHRILTRRHEVGNRGSLDAFFSGRIEWLRGHREKAAASFADAVRAAERYHAQGRLELEARLACELSPLQFLMLVPERLALSSAADAPAAPAVRRLPAWGVRRIVGESAEIRKIRDTIRRVASLDVPVLITGETGTGKELVALSLHREGSRRGQPFLAVNCGAIAETILESELFGHERGAFTGALGPHAGVFEAAGEGIVFLDEIGEISPRLQVALLRFLDTREIRRVGSTQTLKTSCRLVAATNADLSHRVRAGLFREDLLFRLRRLEIHICPLRERPEDIVPLALHFLNEGRHGARADFSPAARERLLKHPWPGNGRELRNVIERMRILTSDKASCDLRDLDLRSPSARTTGAAAGALQALDVFPDPADLSTRPEKKSASKRGAEPALADSTGDAVRDFLLHRRSMIRRLERLRHLFAKYRKLTRGEVIALLNIAPKTASDYLKVLRKEGCIEKIEPNASPRSHFFVLNPRREPPPHKE